MLRVTGICFWALLPMPALAAGGFEDEPLEVKIVVWLVLLLVGAVPAAGVGYVIGSFLRPSASILVLATVALLPTTVLWMSRGFERAIDFAWTPFLILLVFSPLIAFGWRFGRRDVMQHVARKSLLQNGH